MISDLIGWQSTVPAEYVQPLRPEAHNHSNWPPDYRAVYAWRMRQVVALDKSPQLLASAKAYYSTRPGEFILHWMDTYDPRRADSKWVPFVFFERQAEFIAFLHELRTDQESGLIEKARDMGATWLCCAYSVWSWLFVPDDAIGWGSRKQELVDKIGDPDSIFEKLRLLINRLPKCFLPEGLEPKKHLTFMKCVNPSNGSTITGETGDNIGRGGRKSIYFKDESAHYERPEKIEAALGDNTRVQVDISSVNGLGNPFHRRREAGLDWSLGHKIPKGYVRVFIVDWRDHPEKTQEWYDTRRAKYEREGMLHLFAQEVDRNYSAAISNTIIPYDWIVASVDAHERIPCLMRAPENIPNRWIGSLDVADQGIDRNAYAERQWIILRYLEEWGERDPGVTTRRALLKAREHPGIRVQYDAIGLGASVKSEYNRLTIDEGLIKPENCLFVPWNAGGSVLNPYERIIPDDDNSLRNDDFFKNIKAQAWWSLRTRFYKTWNAITNGVVYDPDELISLDSQMPLLNQAMKELAQPTKGEAAGLKMIVNKMPDGMKSPNLGDAIVMAYFPLPEDYATVLVGNYG